MTQKEQNMMKLVTYHLIYMGPGRVSKEKKEKLFVEVYKHFNKNKKKKLKRSDIVSYISELRRQQGQQRAAAFGRVVKQGVNQEGRLLSLAIGAGLMCCLAVEKRTKRTED